MIARACIRMLTTRLATQRVGNRLPLPSIIFNLAISLGVWRQSDIMGIMSDVKAAVSRGEFMQGMNNSSSRMRETEVDPVG